MEIIFQKDCQILEYGKKIDNRFFVKHSFGEAKTYPNVNTKKTSSHAITYILTCRGQTKKISYAVEIKDTRKPTIKPKENHITLEYRQKYDVTDNIKSVRDPVDGPLRKTNKKATGGYWIDSELSVLEAGSYTITIHAQDLNGNSAEKKFTVTVEKKRSRS